MRPYAALFVALSAAFFPVLFVDTAYATCVNTNQAAAIAAAAIPTPQGETPTVTTIETCGGDDVSYQVPITATITFDGQQYTSVYATTNSVITFGRPDNTYWEYPRTPSISLYSMDWFVYPQRHADEHLIINSSDGGFQVDIAARPCCSGAPITSLGDPTNIVITAAINADGTVAIAYSVTGPTYDGQTRTGVRLNDGSIVTLEQYGVVQVETSPTLAPDAGGTVITPEPSASPSASPSSEPSPSPSPSDSPSTPPTPSPSPSTSQIPTELPSPTPSETATSTPDPSPSPTPDQSNSPLPNPSENPSPTPSLEPQPTPEPVPQPDPIPAPTPEPVPALVPEPPVAIEPPVAMPEPTPTVPPIEKPAPPIESPQPPVTPEEPPAAVEEPPVAPEPPVEPAPEPESPAPEPQNPIEEPSQPPVKEPITILAETIEDALSDGKLTEAEKEVVAEALLASVAPGETLTKEQIQDAGIEYKDLPPETPVEVRTDENGNEVIITADVAAALVLLENPAELIGAIFSDPGQALQALGNIGADMSPQERKESQEMVVATVIAAGAAMNAVGAATAGGSTHSGGSSGGGNSGGGGASGETKGVRRRKP